MCNLLLISYIIMVLVLQLVFSLKSGINFQGMKTDWSSPSSLVIPFLFPIGNSVVSESSINFDTIFENLKDLNVLAGEGVSKIEHVAGGARLRQLDPVPLTFYQNGIVMFNGPFRSYEEPSTQVWIRLGSKRNHWCIPAVITVLVRLLWELLSSWCPQLLPRKRWIKPCVLWELSLPCWFIIRSHMRGQGCVHK